MAVLRQAAKGIPGLAIGVVRDRPLSWAGGGPGTARSTSAPPYTFSLSPSITSAAMSQRENGGMR